MNVLITNEVAFIIGRDLDVLEARKVRHLVSRGFRNPNDIAALVWPNSIW